MTRQRHYTARPCSGATPIIERLPRPLADRRGSTADRGRRTATVRRRPVAPQTEDRRHRYPPRDRVRFHPAPRGSRTRRVALRFLLARTVRGARRFSRKNERNRNVPASPLVSFRVHVVARHSNNTVVCSFRVHVHAKCGAVRCATRDALSVWSWRGLATTAATATDQYAVGVRCVRSVGCVCMCACVRV